MDVRAFAKKFIEESGDLIIKGDWDEFYREISRHRELFNRSELNKILENSGILYTSILHKITKVPPYFLGSCEHIPNPLVLPSNIKEIGADAFRRCIKLKNIVIPDSVTSIGAGAFYGCSGFTSITIPNSTTEIGGYAFDNCSGLTSITIPDSVTSIGEYAFYSCSGLTRIDFGGTESQWRAIEKDPAWRYNSGIHIIHCIDGDIEM